ncbi:MAG: tRNA guanosine(34) transglycosylase Tgt [Deltaproteobacteria bacterium]
MIEFRVEATDGAARAGLLTTPHGLVETPIFMPVGTQASVKAVAPDDLGAIGARLVLGNTYHLMLRPGHELIRRRGGLHRFMAWDGPILTDSGGFQVFSLSERRKLTEEGVVFRSHLDGSMQALSPESSIAIQEALGSDIAMAFDECPAADSERAYLEESLARTARWAARSKAAWRSDGPCALFGIVQGALDPELRRRSAEEICALDLPGYALGGYSVGESPAQMHEGVAFSAPLLPADRPRYLMGVGTPDDLLHMVEAGIDMSDCVLPTRCARNGLLFTSRGRLVIRNRAFAEDDRPVDAACGCYGCRTFSRAYLRHLFQAKELLAYRLNSIHNLAYFLSLMRGARQAIREGRFAEYARSARRGWEATPEEDG